MAEIKQLTIFDTIFGDLIEKYDPNIASIKVYGVLDEHKKCTNPLFLVTDVCRYINSDTNNMTHFKNKFKKGTEIVLKKVLIEQNLKGGGKMTKLTESNMLTKYGLIRAIAFCGKETKAHICFRELIYKLFDHITESIETIEKYHSEMQSEEIQAELATVEIEDPGLVYFIMNVETRRIKIGRTTDIDTRLSALQVGNDCELAILRTIPCTEQYNSEKLEKYIHDIFAKQHIRGEWFNLTDEQITLEFIIV
jgi:hypothetical protein